MTTEQATDPATALSTFFAGLDEVTRAALEAAHASHGPPSLEIDDAGVLHGDGVTYIPTPDKFGPLATTSGHIEGIVAHWTDTRGAGAINLAKRLAVPGGASRSCHVWIDRPGVIAQSVPFTKAAWHAGSAQAALYQKRADGSFVALTPAQRGSVRGYGANAWTGGIEFENVGAVRKVGDVWRGWPFGRPVPGEGLGTIVPDDEVSAYGSPPRMYHAFSDAQLTAGLRVYAALVHRYALTREVCGLGHVQIDPQNREDPGPLMMGDAGLPNPKPGAKLGGHLAVMLDLIFGA